jgi:hypothetical protein
MAKNELARVSKNEYAIECLVTDKRNWFKNIRKLEVMDLVKTPTSELPPQISTLNRNSEETTEDAIVLILLNLIEFYNVKQKMSEEQLYDVASLIISEYFYLSLVDLSLCFKQVKTGKLGKVYDRIDGGMIMDWLRKYELNKTQMISGHRQSESDNHKGDNSTRNSGRFIDLLNNDR